MAITTTNARYEGFIFDGENSRTYGVYVTDVEVFGAPVRNVEMISIPGRNGSFALDKGSYENIQVTYKCAMGCESQADFNAGISAFRNMLASRTGYKRLEDEINTSEYRMACFRGGISVPTLNKETATFDVVFDCKPQRYLKSGETAVSVASGGTISNPTLYDASPLLHVWGYGDIGINDDALTIYNDEYGDVLLANRVTGSSNQDYINRASGYSLLNDGDSITLAAGSVYSINCIFDAAVNSISVSAGDGITTTITKNDRYATIFATMPAYTFQKAATADDLRKTTTTITAITANGTRVINCSLACRFLINSFRTQIYFYVTDITGSDNARISGTYEYNNSIQQVNGYSTQRPFADDADFYFDLDIGEAYKIEDGAVVSVNNAVTIPAKLPVLVPGSNTITYDNTITQFKIVPRWWQL